MKSGMPFVATALQMDTYPEMGDAVCLFRWLFHALRALNLLGSACLNSGSKRPCINVLVIPTPKLTLPNKQLLCGAVTRMQALNPVVLAVILMPHITKLFSMITKLPSRTVFCPPFSNSRGGAGNKLQQRFWLSFRSRLVISPSR